MSCCTSSFFSTDTATTEIYTLSLHDALPIFRQHRRGGTMTGPKPFAPLASPRVVDLPDLPPDLARFYSENEAADRGRSEEHTSELQSLTNLVCRLLLEKKKKQVSPKYATSKR